MESNQTTNTGIQRGDYLKTWHDTVAFGSEPFYSRIIKINRVTVQVRTENGDTPKVTKEFAASHLLPEGEWHPVITTGDLV